GGTALIIDYGATDTILGDSFQAMRAQGYVDPLLTPGEADLTAHVKFSRLTEIAKRHGIAVHGPTSQGRFLERLGIEARASQLGRAASETQKAEILSSLRRLTSAEEMGTLFKTLALSHNIQAPPEGFGE
ncbi:MAG: methyltransferase, partial [Sneathiella sp.]